MCTNIPLTSELVLKMDVSVVLIFAAESVATSI